MTQEQPDAEHLHFWSFIDHAVERAGRELPGVDPLAMRMVLTLHRAANMLVYDLESTVHRPRGWSWPGSGCCSRSGCRGRSRRRRSRSCPA
ncbi:hypothetical protein [Streptomyces sp. HC307]|uniref:hypothetical protein n=1 Tax=Streptomyces flavusporus TaxID=3385496 RepID=UPI0039173BAD